MVKLESTEDGLVFRVCEHTPDVVRQVLLERGWTEYDETDSESEGEWNLWWRTQRFKKSEHVDVAFWQRLNHFPRTDAITRKDCLVRNVRRMRCVHGNSLFDFHPLSYILPNEYTKFVSDYARESQKSKNTAYWICKPTDLSRGRGIFVFKDLKDLNYDCPVIVQKYISSPFLISGYKFDLRIYVCVPSFQPLTIYIYQEGIVRFSTDKFDLRQLGNVYSHLTNTSINKYGPAYTADKERVGTGCKWTLSQFRHFLHQIDDVDEILLWQRITNIVTLTIAVQAPTVPKAQSCFEVFGFDILIDQNFKPWLLEVNFSPALSMDCQVDFIAKRSMLNDLVDLLNFQPDDAQRGGQSFSDRKTPDWKLKSRYGKSSHETSQAAKNRRYSRDFIKQVPSSTNKTSESTSKTTKTSDSTLKEDLYDLQSTNPLPRNFSSSSMASSMSSGDSQDRSLSKEQPVVPELKELKLPRKGRNSFTGIVPAVHRRRLSMKSETENLTSRSLPGLNFSSLPSKTSTLPKIKTARASVSKANYNDNIKFTPLSSLNDDNTYGECDMNQEEEIDCDMLTKERPQSRGFVHRSKASTGRRRLFPDAYADSPNHSSASKKSHETNNRKLLGKYQSPYSIRSTSTPSEAKSSSAWPRTRVGDFVLAFPLNETMRKASGANFDPKTIAREVQKITRKIMTRNAKSNSDKRKKSATITRSEALELSFMLKFDEKDSNPLYFWGPQNPPLLSSVLS